jgi:hypothetical protein
MVKPREAVDLIFADFISLQSPNPRIQRPRLPLVEVTGKLICQLLIMEYVFPWCLVSSLAHPYITQSSS